MNRPDIGMRLVDFARFHIGVTEQGGANRGPIVERFQKAVDGKAVGESWCMAFVQYCIKQTIDVHGGLSRIFEAEHCLTVWNQTPVFMRLKDPKVGCVVIWQHGDSSAGHTGIVCEIFADKEFNTVEGNTSAGQGIVSEGDGVYLRRRSTDTVGNMKLVGFIDPFYE